MGLVVVIAWQAHAFVRCLFGGLGLALPVRPVTKDDGMFGDGPQRAEPTSDYRSCK